MKRNWKTQVMGHTIRVVDEENNDVAVVGNIAFEENKIIADLISAAPDMYEAITKCQSILADYILPDSKMTDHECINKLLGILDSANLIMKMEGQIQ